MLQGGPDRAYDSPRIRGSNVCALRPTCAAAVPAVGRVAAHGDGSRGGSDVGSHRPLTKWQHREGAAAALLCPAVLVARGGDPVRKIPPCKRGGADNFTESPFGVLAACSLARRARRTM